MVKRVVAMLVLLQPAMLFAQENAVLEQLRQTAQALRAVEPDVRDRRVPAEERIVEPTIPRDARRLLPIFKHQLRDLFAAVLDASANASGDELKRRFELELAKVGVPGDAERGGLFGFLQEVDVRAWPTRIVLAVRLSVVCGSDTSVYVFERSSDRWRRTLDLESNGYKDVSGARGSASWTIVDAADGWYLVSSDVNPWCTSNWQRIRWVALRPGPSPERPRVLYKDDATIYLGVDEPYRLTTNRDTFTIVWWGADDLDVDILVRAHTATFAIARDVVRRLQPVAFRADDFVDEWALTPWREAARWTRTADRKSARHWHTLLGRSGRRRTYLTLFEFVQPCPDAALTQVGVSFEPYEDANGLPADVPDDLFFMVAQRASAFELVDVSTTPFSNCPGRTPPSAQPRELPK